MSIQTKVPPDVRAAFDRLYEEWLRFLESPELRHSSRPSDYARYPAYEGMVELGAAALPLIVEKLREGQFFLNTAMARITGMDLRRQMPPVTSEQEVARRWVQWWEERLADRHNVQVPTEELLPRKSLVYADG